MKKVLIVLLLSGCSYVKCTPGLNIKLNDLNDNTIMINYFELKTNCTWRRKDGN